MISDCDWSDSLSGCFCNRQLQLYRRAVSACYERQAWIEQTDNGKTALPLEDMDTRSEFYAGTVEDRRFRYLNAKHEVGIWMDTHQQKGLLELFDKLNNGEEFDFAYSK